MMHFSKILLLALFILIPSLTLAHEQLILIHDHYQLENLKSFTEKNSASLHFSGTLSFGDLYLLKSKIKYFPEDHFVTRKEYAVVVTSNSSFSVGDPLIDNKITPDSDFFMTSEDLSNWQWGLKNTGNNTPIQEGRPRPLKGIIGYDANVEAAWKELPMPKKNIIVAVIDTGIDKTHEDLKNQLWVNEKELNGLPNVDDDGNGFIDDINGVSFLGNSSDISDGHGHGTHCSGIIAADHENEIGIKGIAPHVKIMTIKTFDSKGLSNTENLIKGIDYAVKMNADIISASWGGGGGGELMYKAIEAAYHKNIMFIAAAGNDGINNDTGNHYPSSYPLPNIISVAAHNNSGKLAYFSNYGSKKVHIAAPGQYILSTIPNNKYVVWSGTSMATPHVAGAIALLLEQNHNLSAEEIKERILKSSTPQIDWHKKLISSARLNVLGLLENKEIDRGLPKENEWKIYAPTSPLFETSHPLGSNNVNLIKNFHVPGAKFVRLVFSKVDIFKESSASLNIREPVSRSEVERIPLSLDKRTVSDFIIGDQIGFRLSSSRSSSWGLIVESVEYQ